MKRKRQRNIVLVGIMLAMLLVGCGKSSSKSRENVNVKENRNVDENIEVDTGAPEQEMDSSTTDTPVTDILPLLKVKFTAQKEVTITDITEYWKEDKAVTKTKEIPDSLINMLAEHVIENKEAISIDSMLTRNEISQEVYEKYSNIELEVGCCADAIQVDGDNDGIDDLVSLTFYGGTAGFSALEFCKGNGDGTYTETDSNTCFRTTFGVINYENMNYIVLKEFDYDTNYYSGYYVYLYDKGVLVDERSLLIEATDYEMNILQEESNFVEMEEVKNTLCRKEYPSILKNSDYSISGTAEQVHEGEKYVYSCDINNDGQEEYYNKEMFWPSSMGNRMHCSYDFEDSTMVSDISDRIQEGELYTFWFDQVGNQNVLYMYYVEDLDYTLYAFLIQKCELLN